MSVTRTSILLAAVVGAGVATTAKPAHACQSWEGGYWYAVFDKPLVADSLAGKGASVEIETTALGADSSNFVTHEMWYGVVENGTYWTSVGVIDGHTLQGGIVNQHVFWADNRDGGGYHEHYPDVRWRLNQFETAKVEWTATCAWNVYFAGTRLGASTQQCADSNRRLMAGIEATRPFANERVHGYLENWQRKDSSGKWHGDWAGATPWAICPADINLYPQHVTEEALHGPL